MTIANCKSQIDRFQEVREGLFFVVGNHRGGTTLLQSMLTSHSALTMPPETGFFEEVWTRRQQFGDLARDENLRRVLEFLASPACSASDLELPADEIAAQFRASVGQPFQADGVNDSRRFATSRQAGKPDLRVFTQPFIETAGLLDAGYANLFVTLLALYADARGKRRVGEKSPHHIFYVPTLARMFPQARFITLLRDPRAVVNSEMQTTWGSRSAGRIMGRWCKVVDQHQRLLRLLPAERYTLVQYEELVAEPEQTLRRLCHFLGEEFEPSQLRFFERGADERGFRSDETWKQNTLQPLTQERAVAWQTQLAPEQIALIERAAGNRLERLGYAPSPLPKISATRCARHWLRDRRQWLAEVLRAVSRPRQRRRPWRAVLAELLGSAHS